MTYNVNDKDFLNSELCPLYLLINFTPPLSKLLLDYII